MRLIPIADICPDPNQPRKRFPEEHIRQLAASIARRGLLQAITVRANPTGKPPWMIVAGECRWRAHAPRPPQSARCQTLRRCSPRASARRLASGSTRQPASSASAGRTGQAPQATAHLFQHRNADVLPPFITQQILNQVQFRRHHRDGVACLQQSRQFPFLCGQGICPFFFYGPGLHHGRHLFHVQAQPFIGYPFFQQRKCFFQRHEVAGIGGIAELGAVKLERHTAFFYQGRILKGSLIS